MIIRVHPNAIQQPAEAREAIRQAGLHALEMNVPAVSNSSHWHAFSTRFYILEGELRITDINQAKEFVAGPGACVEVPERVLHAEHSSSGYRIIAGMSVDPASLQGPVDLAPDLLDE